MRKSERQGRINLEKKKRERQNHQISEQNGKFLRIIGYIHTPFIKESEKELYILVSYHYTHTLFFFYYHVRTLVHSYIMVYLKSYYIPLTYRMY